MASLGTLAVGASATVTFMVTPEPGRNAHRLGQRDVGRDRYNTSNNSATVSTTVVDRVGTIEFSAAELRRAGERRLGHDHREPRERCAGDRDGRLHDRPDQCDARPGLHAGLGNADLPERSHLGDDRGPGSGQPVRSPR